MYFIENKYNINKVKNPNLLINEYSLSVKKIAKANTNNKHI